MKFEDIELLRELTIVIPTCEKPENLERAIEYWRDTPVTVHIVDGSEKPWFQIGVLQNIPTINYHHLPAKPDEDVHQNYSRRLRFATTLPLTIYSALCADDDAFTISGLLGILKTLEYKPDIDAMIGRAALYSKSEIPLIWQLRYGDLRNSKDYLSKNVATRLLNRDRAPWLYYGIARTPLWKKLYQISFKYSLPELNERLMAIVDKSLCRIQIIEKIVWLRQAYVPRTGMTSSYYRAQPSVLRQIVSMQRFADLRKMRKQILVAIRHSSPNVSLIKAYWLARKMSAPKIIRTRTNFWRIKKRAIRKLIKFFSFIAPETRRKITESLPWRISGPLGYYKIKPETLAATTRTDLESFIVLLKKSDIDFDANELREFEKLILKPREKLRLQANI
jgi:glycosyltransferase domain-containing protein